MALFILLWDCIAVKSFFIGHFSPVKSTISPAFSAAGNQVQRKIFKELQLSSSEDATCYSMCPLPAWPFGKLIFRTQYEGSIQFLGYLNIPVLKHIIFSVRLFYRLLFSSPKLCIQYNSYFFENLVLLFLRFINQKIFLVIIIQDVHVKKGMPILSRQWLRSLSERLSLFLARFFDLTVPISSSIITDFKFKPGRSFVFQGGVTDFAQQLMRNTEEPAQEIGVFAGALESYNGVDRLVDQWIKCELQYDLHIFGQGSLATYLEQVAKGSKRIIFHGFHPEKTILKWQSQARWNFCLRYSDGLHQNYFFPSKLFNVLCAPGAVVGNNFHALPSSLRLRMGIVSDNLHDLPDVLNLAKKLTSPEQFSERKEFVCLTYSWRKCIVKILEVASVCRRDTP